MAVHIAQVCKLTQKSISANKNLKQQQKLQFTFNYSTSLDTAYSLVSVSDQTDCTERRHPSLKLVHPVVEGGLGDQNHVGTGDVSVVLHVTQQGNGLESLSQTLGVKAGR